MTVPGQSAEDTDDDMPPLEYVGAPATASRTQHPPAQADGKDEDSDSDSMPPLDFVGLAPCKAQEDTCEEPEKIAPGTSAVTDDDEMPPLEYVGTSATHVYSFREGSLVRLKGLTKAELNGQTGRILPFLNQCKDRLPVRLDSTGKSISIKPENLESIMAAGPERTPEPHAVEGESVPPLEKKSQPAAVAGTRAAANPEEDDNMPPLEQVAAPKAAAAKPEEESPEDDDMPPLEYVGVVEGAAAKPEEAKPEEQDDDMPPLMYVGTPAKAAAPIPPKPQKANPEEEDDPDMPPLERAGAAPPEQANKPAVEEDDDDMPPLEYVGANAPTAVGFKEGDKVVLKGLSRAELNGKRGTLMSLQKTNDRLPVQLDGAGGKVSIKPENLERLAPGGTAAQEEPKKPTEQPASEEEGDDEMPPLEYVGTAPTAPRPTTPATAAPAPESTPTVDDDDDDMPPLEYVGMPAPAPKSAAPAAQAPEGASTEEDDDDMPPLENVGAPVAQLPQHEEEDDDMPPLEYVGSAAVPQQPAANQLQEPARKPAPGPAATKEPARKPASGPATAKDSDDDMPPLEYVGTEPAANICFREGDLVVLKGLQKAALNGQKGKILPFAKNTKERLPVLLLNSGDQIAIKPVNLERVDESATQKPGVESQDSSRTSPAVAEQQLSPERSAAVDDDDDDDMPPLEYVGAPDHSAGPAPPTSLRSPAQPGKQQDEEEDDDMPPLEYMGSKASPAPAPAQPPAAPPATGFKEGDLVVLKGLSKAELNGQVGTIMPFRAGDARLPVKLKTTGQQVSIKPENLQQTTSEEEEEEEDDMPPLEWVGASPAAAVPKEEANEDDDDMPPLEYVGAQPTSEPAPSPAVKPVVQPSNEAAPAGTDDDDMPPLEYVGSTGTCSFKEGDTVVLQGLSKADLNGKMGTVQPFMKKANGRLPVRLTVSGEKVSIKPENLKAAAPPTADPGDDDDMPPLEYVGAGARPAGAEAAAGGAAATTAVGTPAAEDEESDSMPPLEYVGQATPAAPSARAPSEAPCGFAAGDVVIIKGLQTNDLNGNRAKVVKADANDARVYLQMLETGKKISVKWGNIERAPATGTNKAGFPKSDTDKMPPAEDVTAKPKGPPRQQKPDAEALLELMRQAMQSTAINQVVDALSQVEAAEGLNWGEHLARKKQLLKKLRNKRRKLQPHAEDSPLAPDSPGREPAKEAAAGEQTKGATPAFASNSDKSSQSEKEWVVLNAGNDAGAGAGAGSATGSLVRTAAGPAASPPAAPTTDEARGGSRPRNAQKLQEWCQELSLPLELVDALEAEDVLDPEELTAIAEEELTSFTTGWKMGPRGRFIKAVRRMRALEQAELGSTCGSIA